MVGGSLTATASRWREALAEQCVRTPAHALYVGRSFSEAKLAAAFADANLYVISAGLGVISAKDEVPSYDLTAAGSDGGLNAALAVHSAGPADWWDVLCEGRGLAHLINVNARSPVLLALPCTYVQMIAADLGRLSEADLMRVRLFTSPPGRAELPAAVVGSLMPYDERLESVPTYAGTRADFPQRALRHFVERLQGHRMSLSAGRRAVDKALSTFTIRQIAQGARMNDQQVRQLIRNQWEACDGRRTRLLRFFRDDAKVACEEGRFGKLWREVRDELKGQKAPHNGDEHAVRP